MKKFIALFCTAVMLTVCLCVPSFAVNEDGEWVTVYEGSFLDWENRGAFFETPGNVFGIDVDRSYRLTYDGYSVVSSVVRFERYQIYFDGFPNGDLFIITLGDAMEYTQFSCEKRLLDPNMVVKLEVFSASSASDFSIVDSVTSGVDFSASWVSTFADTIMTTPLLLLAAILTLFGFGVGLFKRLRS